MKISWAPKGAKIDFPFPCFVYPNPEYLRRICRIFCRPQMFAVCFYLGYTTGGEKYVVNSVV